MQTSSNHSSQEAIVGVQPGGPIHGSVRPPGSKSLTNRALICAAMAATESTLTGALQSEDTLVMIESLRTCGVHIKVQQGGRTLVINGQDRITNHSDTRELFIANSGTTVRFLTAMLSAAGGSYRLKGVDRMHQRPIADLVDALSAVQRGTVVAESPEGCPPVKIESRGWNIKPIRVSGNVSSQYLSGLMMAAPVALSTATSDQSDTLTIEVVGELVSRPYVEMTAKVMRDFGAAVEIIDETSGSGVAAKVNVSGRGYHAARYDIEPDASAASYFWAAAAITGGTVTVQGLTPDAIQGDVGFCRVLEQMGCMFTSDANGMTISGRAAQGIDIDMNAISDTVQTLAVVALYANSPTRVRGVAHNRFKETDRIGDLARELRKLGARIDEHDDGMTIHPPADAIKPATLDTYNDHRMAMSFSLAGLVTSGIMIRNPACTTKTYPEFFSDLEALIGRPHHWE